ncbi:MAG: alpha-D-ribose 1-methylphosphonate 5-triphosphate diphosphatase [Pseudoruegeria sp.]
MTHSFTLANARLILATETIMGSIRVEDGKIADIDSGAVFPAGAIDCEGDYIAPGLIELHTDNLERHIQPRPKVDWPHAAAIVAHDAQLAGVGITTVFDAMRVGSIPSGKARFKKYARGLATELLTLRDDNSLKISHFLHLRAEVCSETLGEELAEFGPDDRVGIVSIMDHTPGQRQFRDLDKFKRYVTGKNQMSDADFEIHKRTLYRLRAENGAAHEVRAVAEAKRFDAVLASHDDTTIAHVQSSAAHGIRLAEFPTTIEAAQSCRDNHIAVMMGAPNLIRGGSHSGNVAAAELAENGLLDILSSDYVPAALFQAAIQLGHTWGDMARGLRTVTFAPARAVGLKDRGAIALGLRADLVRFRMRGQVPLLQGVWSCGRQIG